ncbi:MAG: hypothetical protein KDA85_18420, partial [Planctomycetaceae bacterium]|nr:hypothetical protein [Planctomycetaceae bacterium]
MNRALEAIQKSDWNEASQLLTHWDQRLQKTNGTHLWFETRLRLIAMKRLSGQEKQAEALAKQLEQRARRANDWLTLRRLTVLMDVGTPSPLAVITEIPTAPSTEAALETNTAVDTPTAVDRDETPQSDEATADEQSTPLTPVLEQLREQMEELMNDPSEEQFLSLRGELLRVGSEPATDPEDAARLIHMLTFLLGPADDGEELWQWANALAAPHRNSAIVLSVLGAFGDALRTGPNEAMGEKITQDRTEQLFRRSLELDTTRARNYMRAGDHFQLAENQGEAERCFARAFRLERTDSMIVQRLAGLYRDTDRPRDALHVLDLALREGCDDPNIAFDAAMGAFQLEQYDATMTYMDRAEGLGGPAPWQNYYRGLCQYELGQFDESLAS